MAVIALKTEQRCKLCTHPQRPLIDSLLEQRSDRSKDSTGTLVNGEYVQEKLKELGVPNPTRENMSVHWRKHCQKVTGQTGEEMGEEQAQALEELLAILDSDEYPDTMDGSLQRLFALGMAEIGLRIRRGLPSGISPDQLKWVAGELTRRHHNETQADLLQALADGMGHAEITAVKVTVSSKPEVPADAGTPALSESVIDGEWTEADV